MTSLDVKAIVILFIILPYPLLLFTQEQYEETLTDCNQLLSLSQNRSGTAKALTRKTQALSKLGRIKEGYEAAKAWTIAEPKVCTCSLALLCGHSLYL